MEVAQPVYKWSNGGLSISYDTMTARGQVLNFTGPSWVDVKYQLVKSLVRLHSVVMTDSDLLGHADYIPAVSRCLVVLFVGGHAGAPSKKRVRMAYERLKVAGVKVRFCASRDTAERFVTRLSLKGS